MDPGEIKEEINEENRKAKEGTYEEDADNENSEEESDGDETDEEIEPKFCYDRLSNDVPKILSKDAASCIAVHTKFLALGTHLGVIHILDHQGNNIRNKELLLHATTVNQISIDEKGDYLASCSNDGKVAVHGLYSSDLNTSITIERPVRSVALDPNFSKSGINRRFVIGEDKVVLYERQFLTGYRPNVLYQGEGPIRNIKWKDRFIVWASDKTVRVYDINANRTITVIQRCHDLSLRSDLYPCNFFWKDNETLFIGWANTIQVCKIVPSPTTKPSLTTNKDLTVPPSFYVKITSIFTTEFFICGISAFGDALAVLTVSKTPEDAVSTASRPQLKVLEPLGEEYNLILTDTLALWGYQEYRCNDYHLDSLADEGLYYILSLKDFVFAKPRNEDDHITWLLEHDKYKEAVKDVSGSKNLKKYTLLGVGNVYLEHLLELKDYKAAAALCSTIFGKDKDVWENAVYRFAEIGQLCAIAPYVPTVDKLDPTIYEMILNEFLQYDQKGFLNLVKSWPSNVYSIPTILNVVQEKLDLFPNSNLLQESMVELYISDKRFDKALNVLIEIGSKDRVFDLIKDQNLYNSIHDKVHTLMHLNPTLATSVFLDNVKSIPVNLVVSKLKNQKQMLCEYLHKAFLKDHTLGEEHHGLLVELYAEYLPEQLLPFLKTSQCYSLEHALNICQQRQLIKEVVFILGRMGNTKQALEQITENLQDIDQAIEFCKEHNDMELWKDLIKSSLDKPGFITVLLQNIGTHVHPIMLIKEIPTGMEIPGLRDSLVKILQDYALQISLREGCKKILVTDCYSLLEKLNKLHKRGILVSDDQLCPRCERKLHTNDFRMENDIIVYNCRHVFHKDCVPVQKMETCCICSAQKHGTTSA